MSWSIHWLLPQSFRQPPSKLRASGKSDGAGVGGAIQCGRDPHALRTVLPCQPHLQLLI